MAEINSPESSKSSIRATGFCSFPAMVTNFGNHPWPCLGSTSHEPKFLGC